MRMQEPEQQQPFGQEWQASQEHSGYSAQYPGRYEPEQQGYSVEGDGDDYQQQKIYPQEMLSPRTKVLGILGIAFSAIGFFATLAGIIVSSIVLSHANGQVAVQVEGVIGLVGSIVVMLACIAIYVIAIVALTRQRRRIRRRMRLRV